MVDWTNPESKVTDHFRVRECCWLPSWNKLHEPTPDEQENLTRLCQLMELIRDKLGAPVNVHCMIRPFAYNKLVGGAPKSAHILGLACDFDSPGSNCDDVRAVLFPHLDEWNCRMENAPYTSWVHVDLAEPNPNRYFKP